jgi:hypothetical protein
MGTAPAFASVSEALDMVRSGLRFLAEADAAELSTGEQAEILRGLERAHSVATAARTSVLGAFASGCEVHHLTHKADGGTTSVWDCALFCTHHHQVEIHRNGWTVVLNPDGSTTAWNKDRTKTLHSHSRNYSPPARPG